MKDKIFFDTNILIYTIDRFDKQKQKKAREVLKETIKNNTVVISTQVVQEFYVSAIKKLSAKPIVVKEIVSSFERFNIVTLTLDMIKEAIDLSQLNKLSFWDALIITSAEEAKCAIVFSEDLNNGQIIKGVKIVNPLL